MKNPDTKKFLIVIAGPTAIGKTSLGISLARLFNCPVLSADSRQFYKEMHIGNAKPSASEMMGIPHYFINSHSVSENYNVGRFETDAIELLGKLFANQDVVIMVGGSGLYIDAVCKGFDPLPEAEPEIRRSIAELYNSKGIEALQEQIRKLDPEYAATADLNNPQRLSRALEVCITTGQPYSSLRFGKSRKRDFEIIKIGLNMNREKLYQRINERVDKMIEDGLVEEVRSLQSFRSANALQTVGYKEIFEYLDGTTELNTAVDLIKQNTRRFAKRQLTWFRRDQEIKWFEPGEEKEIIDYINQSLTSNQSEK